MHAPANIGKEFEGLSLGDERLDRCARAIVERVISAPAQSFPELLPTSAELEGAYRFFQNENVPAAALLEPHVQASLERARKERVVRIVQDSTALSFGGVREGLGTLGGGGCGFWAQIALAVSGEEERAPLGVVGLDSKVYPTLEEKHEFFQKALRKVRREKLEKFPVRPTVWNGREKWTTIPLRLHEELKGIRTIHVMDQEADNFEVFVTLKRQRMRFVIRGSSARRADLVFDEAPLTVHDKLAESEIVLKRRVKLTPRLKAKGSHPSRAERDAILSVRAARVTLRPANGGKLTLNVVEVLELRPPKEEESINWVLYTTEPIGMPEEIAAVVDHYRARWRIEEFFKALKTGCSIEKRQLTNYDGLSRALALFLPVAWHLLALRTAAQQLVSVPAGKVLTPLQLTVLRALIQERKQKLPEEPSAREALFAVAALGGHLIRNGDPGWLTLGRGYDRLHYAESIWLLGASPPSQRSDQS